MKYFIVFYSFILLSFVTKAQNSQLYKRVAIHCEKNQYLDLLSTGAALDHVHFEKNKIIAELSETEIQSIKNKGFKVDVLINDMQEFYKIRNVNNVNLKNNPINNCGLNPNDTITVPQNFVLGSMAGFFTYQEMLMHLDSMAAKFPNIITIKQTIDTFKTHENRPIYWVKISDNPNNDESSSETQILYDAVHHAREPMSMSQLIFYMYYVLENYGKNQMITYLVDNLEMFFVPCLNPDGYIYNETTNPGGTGMWRKNRRDNLDGTFGVDLNRNYGFGWGSNNTGSSPLTNNETYRGPSPFSEPETQAMKYFCENHNFKINLNYHSFSNVLIYPTLYVQDSLRYVSIAEDLTQYNNYVYGTGMQTLGYSTNGDADDWMFGEQTTKAKQYSFTPEVGSYNDGFWPQMTRIIPLAKENLLANINLALIAGRYVRVENKTNASTNSKLNKVRFHIQSYGLDLPPSLNVSLTSTNPYVKSVGSAITINPVNDLTIYTDSVDYELDSLIPNGTIIDFQINVDNGFNIQSKNVSVMYNISEPIFVDSANNMLNWSSFGTWNTTTESFTTATTSFTDSPFSNYLPNTVSYFNFTNSIDLTDPKINNSFVQYWCKWNLEDGYDYVQFMANDGSDHPLCGMHTTNGVGFTGQPDGEPLYDGDKNMWVKETVSLNDYLGKTIQLKFFLYSDGFVEFDGFYFDDFTVYAIDSTLKDTSVLFVNSFKNESSINIYPNPFTEHFEVHLPQNTAESPVIKLYNVLGKEEKAVEVEFISNRKLRLNASELERGMYLLEVQGIGRVKVMKE